MASTLVMKFGGTSVRDAAARRAAADRVRAQVAAGHRVAVVVSAMGRRGEPYATDTLIGLLRELGEPVAPRELDLAMSAGELLSAAVFAHLLSHEGLPARAFTGAQAGVLTDAQAGAAEILSVAPARVLACLEAGRVAVVAGFQGADAEGEIRTLGRGGSDTSAVALGAALGAAEVEIYTDVPGVADCDPRRVPAARFLPEIGATVMLAMAEEGSKVLHPRAVRASRPSATPLRVRSTFDEAPGTLVHHHLPAGPARPVALAHREGQALLFIGCGLPEDLGLDLPALGRRRYLAPDDASLPQVEDRVLRGGLDLLIKRGWATVSLIHSGPVETPATLSVPESEAVDAPVGVQRWLLPETALDAALAELHREQLALCG